MKSLPQFIADLLATSELLVEQANHLKELAQFFGATTAVPQPPPVRAVLPRQPIRQSTPVTTPATAEPEEASPTQDTVTGHYAVTAQQPITSQQPVTVQYLKPVEQRKEKRRLTPDQKASIRRDWNQFSPHLQTKENRAALAAKYGCSSVQIYAITRDQMELAKNFKGGQGRYQRHQQTSGGQ